MNAKNTEKRKTSRHVANIREILEEIEHIDDFDDHADHAQSLVGRLKSKQRKSIIQSALTGHLQDEDLKPYQAELIKMQSHLEQTDRNTKGKTRVLHVRNTLG